MAELTGKSIAELQQAPSLSPTTNLIVQREGSTRAEKTQLDKISSYLINSAIVSTNIQETSQVSSTNAINSHISSTDPHGDRAYALNLNNNHINQADPHGDRLYTDTKVSNHSTAIDPHGDRAYSNSILNTHKIANDPHGDRQYADGKIDEHSTKVDPHGDRAYAGTLLTNHINATDPHGDRGFITTVVNAHKNEVDPHGLVTRISQLIDEHNNNSTAHNLDTKFNTLTQSILTQVQSLIAQKVGTTIAPIEFGKVPAQYLPVEVSIFNNSTSFPTTGINTTLYVDRQSRKIYIWSGSNYIDLLGTGGSGSSSVLSTDDISPGSNPDRRYYTRAIETVINNKVAAVAKIGEGVSTIYNNSATDIKLKSFVSEGVVKIEDKGSVISIKTNDYDPIGSYNGNLKLDLDSDILKDIKGNELVKFNGEIFCYSYKNAGSTKLLNTYNSWKVNGLLATQGTSTAIEKPSNIVISSNGLVITGTSISTATVECYSMTNSLLGTATTLTEGSFTITLNAPQLQGNLLKLYTVTPEGNRSDPTYFYSSNTTSIKTIDMVSISPDGSKYRGNTSRNANITITNNLNNTIGTATANDFGNFEVTFSTALVSGDTITIKAQLGTTLTTTISNYVVTLPNIQAAYNVNFNYERTVLKGYAEPSSIVEIELGSVKLKTTTDGTGLFEFFMFANPIVSTGMLAFKITNDARTISNYLTITQMPTKVADDPIVSDLLSTSSIGFVYKTITPDLGSNTNAELDIVLNTVLNDLEIKGTNKISKPMVWGGTVNIIRDILGEIDD